VAKIAKHSQPIDWAFQYDKQFKSVRQHLKIVDQ
jgi:hypothetical protein